MKTRSKVLLWTALGCVAVFVLLAGIKVAQIAMAIAQYADFQPPPEAVSTAIAREEDWTSAMQAVGSASAVQGVTVSTDAAGIVSKIAFESGEEVAAGSLLVQLDVSQESAQLRAAQAQMQLAALNLQRQENLIVNRVSSQADYDAAKAEWDKATASVEEVKALIEKKTIRAPFGGVIGIRQINLGEYLESGAPIAPLQSLDPIHVDFFLPQHQLSAIKPGQPVAVQADGVPGVDFRGRVNAVNSVIDEATRNVRVQATLTNPSATLRPGMYVDVTIPSDKPERLVTIPATAIQYAPYGDSVFIVEEMKDPKGNAYKGVRQQVVKLGESRGDIVAVISGVQPGEEVVTAGVFKLRQGAPVAVNNAIVPSSNTDPSPEDT